jgi:aminopeptidase-like protein
MYPAIRPRTGSAGIRTTLNVLAYSDGRLDLVGLADRIGEDALTCASVIADLERAGLLERVAEV